VSVCRRAAEMLRDKVHDPNPDRINDLVEALRPVLPDEDVDEEGDKSDGAEEAGAEEAGAESEGGSSSSSGLEGDEGGEEEGEREEEDDDVEEIQPLGQPTAAQRTRCGCCCSCVIGPL